MAEVLTLSKIAKHFQDESEAYKLVERIRWPHGPVCPHCGSVDHAYFLDPKEGTRTTRKGTTTYRRVWKCADCRQQFSVLVGTIFEDSKIPLSKWLLAIHEMCSGKNSVSAHELHRQLGVTYKSAWFMGHRIRYAMARPPLVDKLQAVVEVDETYVGGEAKGVGRGRGVDSKVPVFTLLERGGEVRSQVMKRVNRENIRAVLHKHMEPTATLMTDSPPPYIQPGKDFAAHERWTTSRASTRAVAPPPTPSRTTSGS